MKEARRGNYQPVLSGLEDEVPTQYGFDGNAYSEVREGEPLGEESSERPDKPVLQEEVSL